MNFQPIQDLNSKKSSPTYLHLSVPQRPGKEMIFTIDEKGNLRSHTDGKVVILSEFRIKGGAKEVKCLNYNKRFDSLAVGYSNGEVVLYRISSKKNNKLTFRPHMYSVNSIGFSVDMKKMVTCSDDKNLKVYELEKTGGYMKPKFLTSVISHSNLVLKAEISSDMLKIFSIDPKCFRVTDLSSKKDLFVCEHNGLKGVFQSFYILSDHLVLLEYATGKFEIFDVDSNRKIQSFQLETSSIVQTCLSKRNNRLFAICKENGQARKVLIIDIDTGINQYISVAFELKNLRCDDDGYRLFLAGDDGLVLFADQKVRVEPESTKLAKKKTKKTGLRNISNLQKTKIDSKQEIAFEEASEQEKAIEAPLQALTDSDRLVMNSLNQFSDQIKTFSHVINNLDGRLYKTDNGLEQIKNTIEQMQKFEEDIKEEKELFEKQEELEELEVKEKLISKTIEPEREMIKPEFSSFNENHEVLRPKDFIMLKNQMKADLETLKSFVTDRESGSEKFQDNFSFRMNDVPNVFDNVIGQDLKENTSSFTNLRNIDELAESRNFNGTLDNQSFGMKNGLTVDLKTDQFNYTLSEMRKA